MIGNINLKDDITFGLTKAPISITGKNIKYNFII